MKIEKKSVISDRVSCNFCKKGQLGKDGKSLVYPYDEVFMFVSQDGGIAPCICQDCLNELFEKSPRTTNDDLEKAAVQELIHSYATCVDGELAYQRNAMLNMFRKGARWQIANMWVPMEERLPEVDTPVFVLTANDKISVSSMYTPKDCHGNVLGEKEWKGSASFKESIIA